MMPLPYGDVRLHDGIVTTADCFQVGTGQTTLLLVDTAESPQLSVRPNRRWIRLATRLLVSSLDRKLAQGRSPESSWLLAARAQTIVTPVSRRALADSWGNLLMHARRPPGMRNPRVQCNRAHILACEHDIRELQRALVAPLPSPARGMAMASWLLRDGSGPIYNRRLSEDLGNAIGLAIAQLNPAVLL